MAVPVARTRKSGNPNWGRPIPHALALPTEFELRARRLHLTQEMYISSVELRIWCEQNRNRCYVPEWLLKEWGITIDLGFMPFEQNVSRTKEAVEAAKTINPAILVEGGIGDIGTGSEIHEIAQVEFVNLTTPEETRQFVHSTGVDVLAPAVGNMHGMVKSMVQGETKKHLDVERISQIKKAAGIFLTLHGGSGTDDEDFLKAIAAGINIIHINTELRIAWRRSLGDSLAQDPNEVVPYRILPPVIDSVKHVVSSRLKLFSFPPVSQETARITSPSQSFKSGGHDAKS